MKAAGHTYRVVAYEHVAIRVTDRDAARRFYELLGWREELDLPAFDANEMVNEAGVHINLIFNGVKQPASRNVLQDEPLKYPGHTHAAFVVDDLDAMIEALKQQRIPITDGPVVYGERRRLIFIRDPDGNVLEFNELIDPHATR